MTEKFTLPIGPDGVLSTDELLAELAAQGQPVETDSRDDTAPTLGRVIRDTTDDTIYVGDGSQWQDKSWLSTGGSLGSSGEFVKLDSALVAGINATTTATSYSVQTPPANIPTFDFGNLPSTVESLHLSLNLESLQNDTGGETAFARLRLRENSGQSLPDSEVSSTAPGTDFSVTGPLAPVPVSAPDAVQVEARVTAGTATLKAPVINIWGQLK